MSHLLELVAEADRDRNGKIDFDEWQIMGAVAPFVPKFLMTLTATTLLYSVLSLLAAPFCHSCVYSETHQAGNPDGGRPAREGPAAV